MPDAQIQKADLFKQLEQAFNLLVAAQSPLLAADKQAILEKFDLLGMTTESMNSENKMETRKKFTVNISDRKIFDAVSDLIKTVIDKAPKLQQNGAQDFVDSFVPIEYRAWDLRRYLGAKNNTVTEALENFVIVLNSEPKKQKKNKPETDASKQITEAATPIVQEALRINFSALFEYAACISEILSKDLEDKLDADARELLVKTQNDIFAELGIEDYADFAKLQENQELFLARMHKFVQATSKLGKEGDVLDLDSIFKNLDEIKKNTDINLTKVASSLGQAPIFTSFMNARHACEDNHQQIRFVLSNIIFLREQAKNVTLDLESPLAGITTFSKSDALNIFGIKKFLQQSMIDFSYKELSNLVRVRTALHNSTFTFYSEEQDSLPKPPNYTFTVSDRKKRDFSHAMENHQTKHLRKNARLCAMQMQMANGIITNIDVNQIADKTLREDLQALIDIYNSLKEAQDINLEYNEQKHIKLNNALNKLCSSFYPNIGERALHILANAGNIQRKFDYKIFMNDMNDVVYTSTPFHRYNSIEGYFNKMYEQSFLNDEFINIEAIKFVGDTANNVLDSCVGKLPEKEMQKEIGEFYTFAHYCSVTFGMNYSFDNHAMGNEKEILALCQDLPIRSYIEILFSYIINACAYISSFLQAGALLIKSYLPNVIGKVVPMENIEDQINKPQKLGSTKHRRSARSRKRHEDAKESIKLEASKAIIGVQLEQQAIVLAKTLELANALGDAQLTKVANAVRKDSFNYRNIAVLNLQKDKKYFAYYSIKSINAAIEALPDDDVRQQIYTDLARYSLDKPLEEWTLEECNIYIKKSLPIIAHYPVEIDIYFKQCRDKIKNEIITKALNDQNIAGNRDVTKREAIASMEILLAIPSTLEAVKNLFLFSPLLQDTLLRLRRTFIYNISKIPKFIQAGLYRLGIITEKNKNFDLVGSIKNVAKKFSNEQCETNAELQIADRLIARLKTNPTILASTNDQHTKLENPFNRNFDTLTDYLHEAATNQLLEVLQIVIRNKQLYIRN